MKRKENSTKHYKPTSSSISLQQQPTHSKKKKERKKINRWAAQKAHHKWLSIRQDTFEMYSHEPFNLSVRRPLFQPKRNCCSISSVYSTVLALSLSFSPFCILILSKNENVDDDFNRSLRNMWLSILCGKHQVYIYETFFSEKREKKNTHCH